MRITLTLTLLFFCALPAAAQVPVPGFVNPGCEAGVDPPTGWTDNGGDMRCFDATSTCNTPADEGTNVFAADLSATTSTVRQTIDLSSEGTGAENRVYTFSGAVRDCFSNSTDDGRFTIEFLNAIGTVIGSQNATFGASFGSWADQSVQATSPVGTRQVRVAVSCVNNGSTSCDVQIDDLALSTDAALPVELAGFEAALDGSERPF